MRDLLVWKFGGSILKSPEDANIVARTIARCHGRIVGASLVVVVSAPRGETDRRIAEAAAFEAQDPDQCIRHIGEGEVLSARLVAQACARQGLRAQAIEADEVGIRTEGPRRDATPVAFEGLDLGKAIAQDRIVIVPGFIGRDELGRATLLGRGGSDFTAVFLAHAMSAGSCRLFKDVGGVFESCAPVAGARPLARLSWPEFFRFDPLNKLVQRAAALYAQRAGMTVEIAAVDSSEGNGTLIVPG